MKVTDVTQNSCPTSSALSPHLASGLAGFRTGYMVECIVKSVIAKVKICFDQHLAGFERSTTYQAHYAEVVVQLDLEPLDVARP